MYTDPGMLSLIIAAVAGGILAIPLYIKSLRYRIKEWFNNVIRKK